MSVDIRLATAEDAAQILAIYAPIVRDTIISFELEPPDVDDMRQRIVNYTRQYPWLVCDRDGEIAGYAYASLYRARKAYQWSTEVSAYTHESYRRRGVGRALYESLFVILKRQGYVNAYGGVALPNAGSVGLHLAMGFEPIGVYKQVGYKHGGWHDVAWYQLALQPPAPDPAPPISIQDLAETPGFSDLLATGLSRLKL